MTTRENASNVKVTPALNHAAISSNTTTVGTIIDTLGFDALTFSIQSATITDGTYTPLIEVGDAANLSDAAVPAAAELTTTTAAIAFISTDDNVTKKIGYVGPKRYARLSLVSTGVTSGGGIGATALLSFARQKPVA